MTGGRNFQNFDRIDRGIKGKPKNAHKIVESTKRQIPAFVLLKQCTNQHCLAVALLIDNEINAHIKCWLTVIGSTVRHHKI